jgi:CheY-like chemotaxis protein
MKVLVADDDVTSIFIFKQILRESGHAVVSASNGKHCLTLYQQCMKKLRSDPSDPIPIQPFDAVMIDFQISDPSAPEIAKEILTISPHQRIIFISSSINEGVLESIRKLDVPLAVLQKPISDKSLIDTVEGSDIYKELKKYKFDVDLFKKGGWSHELLKKIVDALENNPLRW